MSQQAALNVRSLSLKCRILADDCGVRRDGGTTEESPSQLLPAGLAKSWFSASVLVPARHISVTGGDGLQPVYPPRTNQVDEARHGVYQTH
jgi:hypothetical protein